MRKWGEGGGHRIRSTYTTCVWLFQKTTMILLLFFLLFLRQSSFDFLSFVIIILQASSSLIFTLSFVFTLCFDVSSTGNQINPHPLSIKRSDTERVDYDTNSCFIEKRAREEQEKSKRREQEKRVMTSREEGITWESSHRIQTPLFFCPPLDSQIQVLHSSLALCIMEDGFCWLIFNAVFHHRAS